MCACVDGHDDDRVVGQQWRLDIDRQRDAVVACHEHVQLVIVSMCRLSNTILVMIQRASVKCKQSPVYGVF